MRQTLFRINVVDLWSLEPIGGVAAVGAGYLVVAAALVWAAAKLCNGLSRAAAMPAGPAAAKAREGESKSGFWAELIAPAVVIAVGFGLRQALLGRNPELLAKGLPVFGYGAMVFLGFVCGGWVALRQAARAGIASEAIWDLVTWVFVAGIGGARIFYLLQKHDSVFSGATGPGDAVFRAVNLSDGGLVLLGGVLAVVVAVIIFCRRRGVPPLRMGDVLVAPFFVGLGFGRVGCLLNGCCFGDRCTLPWSIHFPAGSVPWDVLYLRGFLGSDAATTYGLHPTQVYSSITAFVLAGLTAAYFRRRPYDGAVLVVGMLLYAVKRFVIEFLRGDELGQFGTMFTVSQWISAGIFLGGIVLWAWLAAARPKGGGGLGLAIGGPAAGRN